MALPVFRTAYDSQSAKVSVQTSFACPTDSSLTHQSFKDECDINLIIERLDVSGFLDGPQGPAPQFFDASEVPDYQAALNQVLYAQGLFDDLDAGIRKRFRNDPGEFVSFFQDPANQEEAIALGLATRVPDAEGAPQAAEGASGARAASAAHSGSSTPPAAAV